MQDKLAKANANIESLIDIIMFYEKRVYDGICVGKENCIQDCDKHQEEFFNKLKQDYLERYLIK